MTPKKITVVYDGGRQRFIQVTESNLDTWLQKLNRESLVCENVEIIDFESLVDGGTYTLGPPVQQQQSVVPNVEQLLPLLTALPDLLREVGMSRKSRLNCWERESMRTSGSKRSRHFRKKVIEYYKRASNSGKKVKCQILNEYILKNEAENEATGIIAAHIWKASTRGHGLEDFGLEPEKVNSPRNGLFLTKGLEEAFGHQQVCFLYNLLENKIVLWVADTSLMNKTIAGSGKTTDGSDMKFSVVHQQPLLCPPNCLPFRRLLSWHARLTLELRPQTVQARRFKSAYDISPGRENVVIDPITRAISEMVEPGDDASA